MPRITKYSSQTIPSKGNMFSNLWDWFFSFDKFTRFFIITGAIIIICVPAIVGQETGFFSHASSSVFTNCVNPPPGFDQQELDMLSQNKQVNWCKTQTLAQINPQMQDNTTQDNSNQSNTQPSSGPDFFSGISLWFRQLFLSIRKLLTGY